MLKKSIPLLVLLLAAVSAQAQSTPAKAELATRIVRLQQPGIESLARALAEQPAATMLERARPILNSRVAADKREAVAGDIQADVKKYVDESVPLVRDRALKLAPETVGAFLQEKFTEEELRQVIAVMESPAWTKFQQLGADMQRVLQEKVVADTRATVEPKLKALEKSVAKRLGIPETQTGAGKPAKPASK